MSLDFKIRNAQEVDLPAILDIFNYEIINTQYVYIYEPWTLEYLKDWFVDKQKNSFPLIVAVVNDKVVGYATYGKFRDKPAYYTSVEYSVYLDKDFRRKGIGNQLVKSIIELARENGCKTIIGGLDAENKASLEFHRSLGFEEVAHIKSVAKKFGKWLDLTFFQLILHDD